jgi:hypothetical protein
MFSVRSINKGAIINKAVIVKNIRAAIGVSISLRFILYPAAILLRNFTPVLNMFLKI